MISDASKAIAHHRRFTVEIAVDKTYCAADHVTLTQWSSKARNIIYDVESLNGWSKYFGGVVLDEEAGFGYKTVLG